mgnify:CR=1 FL=1
MREGEEKTCVPASLLTEGRCEGLQPLPPRRWLAGNTYGWAAEKLGVGRAACCSWFGLRFWAAGHAEGAVFGAGPALVAAGAGAATAWQGG